MPGGITGTAYRAGGGTGVGPDSRTSPGCSAPRHCGRASDRSPARRGHGHYFRESPDGGVRARAAGFLAGVASRNGGEIARTRRQPACGGQPITRAFSHITPAASPSPGGRNAAPSAISPDSSQLQRGSFCGCLGRSTRSSLPGSSLSAGSTSGRQGRSGATARCHRCRRAGY